MDKLQLSDNEKKLLSVIISVPGDVGIDYLSKITGLPESTINAIIELLKSKGLVREEISYKIVYTLTEEGKKALSEGLPEEKLTSLLLVHGPLSLSAVEAKLGKKELQIALGAARKRGIVEIKGDTVVLNKEKLEEISSDREILKIINEGGSITLDMEKKIEVLIRRGLVKKELKKERRIRAELPLAKLALERSSEVLVKLTSYILTTGNWRNTIIKEYNVEALPPKINSGLPHFYILFIERIKDILKSLGFTEVSGPIVESEFWNFDVLFQAQDHPSREIHDTFWVDYYLKSLDASEEIIERTRTVHETGGKSGGRGWGGFWKLENAMRTILRTQMTSVSARTLASNPKPPFKFFAIGKVFRPDLIDSRHLPEFYQLDAIIGDENMSFSGLLGAITEFFEKMGLKEVRFKPAYFPFTEPSVEGYVKIEPLGWVEVFGAGMFRPEVLEIVGTNVPVGAWGMGLDRLAMALLGIDDIRKLYSKDVNYLRRVFSEKLFKLI